MATALRVMGKLSLAEHELRAILREPERIAARDADPVPAAAQLRLPRVLGSVPRVGPRPRVPRPGVAGGGSEDAGERAEHPRQHPLRLGRLRSARYAVLRESPRGTRRPGGARRDAGHAADQSRRLPGQPASLTTRAWPGSARAYSRAVQRGYRRVAALAMNRLGRGSYPARCVRGGGNEAFAESDGLASRPEGSYHDILFQNAYRRWEMASQEGNGTRERIAFGRLRHLRSLIERTIPRGRRVRSVYREDAEEPWTSIVVLRQRSFFAVALGGASVTLAEVSAEIDRHGELRTHRWCWHDGIHEERQDLVRTAIGDPELRSAQPSRGQERRSVAHRGGEPGEPGSALGGLEPVERAKTYDHRLVSLVRRPTGPPIRFLVTEDVVPGDDLDPDVVPSIVDGRPFVAWWRNEGGVGQVYVSLFLSTRWSEAYPDLRGGARTAGTPRSDLQTDGNIPDHLRDRRRESSPPGDRVLPAGFDHGRPQSVRLAVDARRRARRRPRSSASRASARSRPSERTGPEPVWPGRRARPYTLPFP